MLSNDDIKEYDQKRYDWLKKYDIKTEDDFKRFCHDRYKDKKHALLLSMMKFKMIKHNECLDRLTDENRLAIGYSPDLDWPMRIWMESLPKFDIFCLVMLADVYFGVVQDPFEPKW